MGADQAAGVSIPTKSIGNDVHGKAVSMPMSGIGTKGYNNSVARAAVQMAITHGVTLIDTAYTYGCQVGVAQGIQDSGKARSGLFVITKVRGGQDFQTTVAAHDLNLKQLGTNYSDLVLADYPCYNASTNCSKAHRQETWKALEQIYNQGKARAIGVSHYCQLHLQDILDIKTVPISVNQQEWHVGMGSDPHSLVSFCKNNGILYQSFSPLCGDCDSKSKQELLTGDLTTTIGVAHGASAAQVALRWLLEAGSPVIPRTTSLDHLKENLNLFGGDSWGDGLSATELAALNAATSPASGTPVGADCSKPNLSIEV